MKKISKKLSLNRETLATLSPELLDSVGGGQAIASLPTRTVTTILPTTRPISLTVCRTRLVCPPVSLGGAKGQE